ncbi:MAG: serine/threonine protein kinase, partial [Labilithrix sp.]|nr:serine/threonine protein kinase [Labilithrix sp.]
MIDLSAGQVVADKYRVDAVIGAGGMGVVVAATRLELEQRVAIKLLRDASPDSVARFQREARLIVRLKSAHVARVFDIGALDDETPFIVMELLEGEDLARLLERRGRLPVEQAVDYVLEACEAVAEAHTLGMVHRDLKPANLFVARGPGGTGSVKVLDFGISKSLDDRSMEDSVGGLTNEGVALGSPGYMAPEQITSSRDVDVRADIYSIGAILYRLVSGKTPHKGDSLMSVLASMATVPLAPLSTLVPDVPRGFADVVGRCLARDRGERPASIAELARAVAPFGSRRARSSTEQILATMGVAPDSASETMASVTRADDDADTGVTLAAPLVTASAEASANTMSATIVSPLAAPPAWVGGAHGPLASPVVAVLAAEAPARSRSTILGPLIAAFGVLAGMAAWLWVQRAPPDDPSGAAAPPIAAPLTGEAPT